MGKQETEMLKGTLEGMVLAILRDRPAYGYEITAWLREQGFADIAEGTVYAVLVRIERNGQTLDAARWQAGQVSSAGHIKGIPLAWTELAGWPAVAAGTAGGGRSIMLWTARRARSAMAGSTVTSNRSWARA